MKKMRKEEEGDRKRVEEREGPKNGQRDGERTRDKD